MTAVPRRQWQSGQGGAPWCVGVLWSQTGVTAVIEQTQLKGTLLAIEEINAAGGINGRELVPVIYDPRSEPAMFARYAKKLLCEDKVTSIFGCYTSSSRKAVMPVVERMNGLLWYPTLYEGFEYSPNVVYTGSAPNQTVVELVVFLMNNFGPRFYLIGSDYVYPHESNRIMRDVLEVRGGRVVAERYVDFRAKRTDFRPVIDDIRQTAPDVIFSTVVGTATSYLYQAYADAGFNPKVMPIASLTTSEAEVQDMGFDVAERHITAAAYFQSLRSPANEAFVARFRRRFGDDAATNMCAEAAYFQVHIFARALAQTNTMETDVLRPMVLGAVFEAPQGRIAIDFENNHTQLWSRIGRVTRQGNFEIVREGRAPARPDPYLVSL